MLVHHSKQTYKEAASDAARHARQKLMEDIERGKVFASNIIERVQTEVPEDAVVRSRGLRFDGDEDSRRSGEPVGLLVGYEGSLFEATKHSRGQLCQRSGMPRKYLSWLEETERRSWGIRLAANNFREIFQNQSDRFLLRSYGGKLRGFLSDRYKRRDSRPLLDGFIEACNQVGALPYDGIGSDTRVSMKAVLPRVFEPIDNEVLSIGCMWENSDYGAARNRLWVFVSRLWCTNKAIMTTGFSQVHLGSRLPDNPMISQKTVDMDTKVTISAMKDVIGITMSPDTVEVLCEVIREAGEKQIDPTIELERFKKRFSAKEFGEVKDRFNTPDVVQLPPGNTAWRMSNAVSWLANDTSDSDRKLELMKISGEMLTTKK
jgi:hypothetical protein